jgi:hypothetical protein
MCMVCRTDFVMLAPPVIFCSVKGPKPEFREDGGALFSHTFQFSPVCIVRSFIIMLKIDVSFHLALSKKCISQFWSVTNAKLHTMVFLAPFGLL